MTQLLMRRPDLNGLPALPDLPTGLALREYREGDMDSLAALLRAAFADDVWTVVHARETLMDAEAVRRTFVIADCDRVVATASARLLPEAYPGSGYVHWVAVHPDAQGRRLGYGVSLAVLHEFVRLGCRDAVLETDDHRLAAIQTYANLGFRPVSREETHAARWQEIAAKINRALVA